MSSFESVLDHEWEHTLKSILGMRNSSFRNLPKADRFEQILETVVPPRKDPTYEKVTKIVQALIRAKAIRKDEGAQMYNALLQRINRYNSNNVQNNLDRLVTDVREAIAVKERNRSSSLGSLVTLNAFLSTLPANVERGQENYIGFINALKTLVMEAPQSTVYQSGPHYFFQTMRNGSQTVNLTTAFENLKKLWGVQTPSGGGVVASSLLTPNTRLLLLLVAPFTDNLTVSRSTYLGHLLTLYREAIGEAHINEQTYNEITNVSRDLRHANADDLQATLNFLLTNKEKKLPSPPKITEQEEQVLRYLQEAVRIVLKYEGKNVSNALDRTAANLDPSFYAANREFINKLMDYFHRAAALAPRYFRYAILNKHWLPPPSFYTGNYSFPDEDYDWEEENQSLTDLDSIRVAEKEETQVSPYKLTFDDEDQPTNNFQYMNSLKETNIANNGIDELLEEVNKWKTHKQTFQEDLEEFAGKGIHNPFAHLTPKGVRGRFYR